MLSRNARVEIDANGQDIVIHGYTFTKSIAFLSVYTTIADSMQPEGRPILISLECHVPL
jgi:Phosphatidylinositol-specific phospholipase C, X domain